MLDLREANLMMVGSSVQETLCAGHVLSESVISSRYPVLQMKDEGTTAQGSW